MTHVGSIASHDAKKDKSRPQSGKTLMSMTKGDNEDDTGDDKG